MKPIFCFYSQFNNFLPRTAIEAEILFAVCLSKKQALTGGKSLACEDKCSKKIGAVLVQQADRRSFEASAVFNFVFFVMLKNKIEQSAAQSCLRKKLSLSEIPTDRTFGNRWSRYKELGKKVPQAYRVYVEDSFLPCDAGDARIFSKEVTHTDNSGDNEEQKVKRYYYHSDHLGSAQFVIDWKGRQYEHIEYTPYGELWTYKSKTAMLFLTTYNNFLAKQPAGLIEETAPGVDKLPFRFTGKELDEETGLYYYGARYLDPKYSRWISTDPALGEYIPKAPIDEEAKKYNQNLPGMGGVFNHINSNLYHYVGNNPIRYIDPDGRSLLGKLSAGACFVGAALVLAAGTAIVGTTAVIIAPAALKLSAELAGAGVLLAAVDEASEYAGQKLKQRAQAVAPAPVPNGPDDNNKEKNTKKTSTNQMNQQIKKG